MKEGEVATLCHVCSTIASYSQLQRRIASAPNEPGVYRWKDAHGTVIYVGKAKNLRKRLQSYLRVQKSDGPWRRALREAITDVDMTVTGSELDALILETNLMKELQPKYNVLMKDGKNYLFVRIRTEDPFPRVNLVRRIENDGAEYFGPYLTKESIEGTLAMLHELYAFRACERSLDRLNKGDMNDVPCLEYQIGRCSGLCAGILNQEEYRRRIEQVVHFLRGHQEETRKLLRRHMTEAAAEQKFEKAANLRNALAALEKMPHDSPLVADATNEEGDIFGVVLRAGHAHVTILLRRHGRIVGDVHFALQGEADSKAGVLEQFLPQYYGEHRDIPPIILLPTEVVGKDTLILWLTEKRGGNVQILIPERGRKSRLLQLAEKNAAEKARQMEAQWEAKLSNTEGALGELQHLLHLPAPPHRMEGYDISHLSGTETVGSMVVTIDGRARSDQYRSFTIRTLKEGAIDDCAALREVLTRRLRYLTQKGKPRTWKKKGCFLLTHQKHGKIYVVIDPKLEQYYAEHGFRHVLKTPPILEKNVKGILKKNPKLLQPLVMVYDIVQNKPDRSLVSIPDLLVMDGGKGQLSTALRVLRKTRITIPVVALAKREEELFIPGSKNPLPLPKESPALFLLMRLRDEAHRFANRHREKRIRNRLFKS